MDDPEYYSTDCNSTISWCLVRNAAVYDGYNSYYDDNYLLGGRVFTGGTPVNEPNFNGVTVSSLQVDSHCYTAVGFTYRSEEHTSELQSLTNLVCRLLL